MIPCSVALRHIKEQGSFLGRYPLAALSAQMIQLVFGPAFAQQTGNLSSIYTDLAALIVTRKFGLTMTIL